MSATAAVLRLPLSGAMIALQVGLPVAPFAIVAVLSAHLAGVKSRQR